MSKKRLVKELERIVGRGMVLHHPDDLLVFEYDGSVDRALPSAVVFPADTEEVSRVVGLAYREGVPVVPRGAGTGLSGGAIAAEGGIEVALTRMRRVLELDPANRIAVVEPGLVNLDLSRATAKFGLFYAPDPSSQQVCTIGGNVAENAGGPHCLRYGVTTNHVLGLEVVLEDGSVAWLGDRFRGHPGYDLVGAFVSSEGVMGVVTKVVARLLPVPEAVRTLLAVFPDIDQASGTVSRVIGSGIVPTALEMMDNLAIRAVETAMNFGYPEDAGAILLIEVDGLAGDVVEQAQEIEALCRSEGAWEVRVASEAEERERLWKGRKGALGALGVLAPNLLPGGRRGAAQSAPRGAAKGRGDRRGGRLSYRQCVPCRRRQPAPLHRVRRAAARAHGAGPGGGRRDLEGLRRSWRDAHRRARRRLGEEGVHAAHLLQRRPGGDDEAEAGLCPQRPP